MGGAAPLRSGRLRLVNDGMNPVSCLVHGGQQLRTRCSGGLLHNGHPHIREVLKATREPLALPKHVSVPEPTQYEHATAILTLQEIDKALEPSEECIHAPLSAGFRQQVAERSTSPRKHSCQTPPAVSKSARIAIKAKAKILFIDAADLIAVEAKGNHVLLVHTSSSHILRGAI